MKTEKMLSVAGLSLSIGGFAIMIIFTVINLAFFQGKNETIDLIACIGALSFMTPFFLFQFLMPSGLLDRFGFKSDIPFWGKAAFYLLLFPFANMWTLASADAIFHFLPNYHAAMSLGFGKDVVQMLRHEAMIQAWTIMAIAWGSMILLGLITKTIRQHVKPA